MLPYASVVIPTHDRAGTLPLALASIQRQTVANIEILIAGDGASAEVAAAARRIAEADSRVRFLDFEKAPGGGGANRDRAVWMAVSDRIFYCDDDDLWLPQHVEKIGPHLDHSHVVDTLPVSVGICTVGQTQRLHASLVNGANRQTRTLLAQDRLKLIFDTHLAHRKSCYADLGRPWAGSEGSPVSRLLAAFASSDRVRWTTLPVATALSLHGVGRTYMKPTERVAEIGRWLDRSAQWAPEQLLGQADFTWHLIQALLAVPPPETETTDGYFAEMGIGWGGERPSRDADIVLPVSLHEQQRRAVALAFELFQGQAAEGREIETLVPQLLDVVLGTFISVRLALRILKPFGKSRALEIVQSIERAQPESAHLTSLLAGHLLANAKRFSEARAIVEKLAEEGSLPSYDLTRLLTRIDLAEGKVDSAVARVEAAWQAMPKITTIGLDLASALIAANRKDEALSLCKGLEERLPPGHPGLQNRYRLLGYQDEPPLSTSGIGEAVRAVSASSQRR